MFTKYFQDELHQLRELGAQFSKAHPSLAPMLSGPQADPDVERLLEGTAFLTALLRQKLDDEFPEIVQDLLQLVAPHLLKPVPSATIQAFHPKSTVRQSVKLPAGILCGAAPIDGVSCLFRTCYPVEMHPLTLVESAFIQRPGRTPVLKLVFQLQGLSLAQWKPEALRLYLGDEFAQAADLYLLLRRHVRGIQLISSSDGRACTLAPDSLRPVGFAPAERLVPTPAHAFPGIGVLQDYFWLPRKFLFLDLVGWERWENRGSGQRFEVHVELDPLPQARRLSRESFILNATPAVNLFPSEAEPLYVDHTQFSYHVRPAGAPAQTAQIFSVDEVKGFVQGTCEERLYQPFDRFRRPTASAPVYRLGLAPSPVSAGVDTLLSVLYPADQTAPLPETLTLKLTCTNGTLPMRLRAGDLSVHGKGCPEYVTFGNLLPPSAGALPPIGKNLLPKLLTQLSVGFQSLERKEVLTALLDLFIPEAWMDASAQAHRRRVQGIEKIRAHSSDRLVQGMVMRGREISAALRDEHFAGRGDAFLFGCALDYFFGDYASINAFVRLTIQDQNGGNACSWPPRMGARPLI